jgi:PIN domain nuclease of toxin-antitoxin system
VTNLLSDTHAFIWYSEDDSKYDGNKSRLKTMGKSIEIAGFVIF